MSNKIGKRLAVTRQRKIVPRGEKRRIELLAIAEKVFLKRGYAEASIDEIAEHAGASKATIYKYFGSKEGLFAASVRYRVPEVTNIPSVPDNGSVAERLIIWGRNILKRITAPRSIALYRIIMVEAPRTPEIGRIFYEAGPAKAVREIADLIRQATQRGEMKCNEPEEAAELFISLLLGNWLRLVLVGIRAAPPPGDKHVKRAVKMLMSYYK